MDIEGFKGRKKLIEIGAIKGLITGLLVTLFDSLYMLISETYVPKSYPFLLISFNTIFWTTFGCISGLVVWFFISNKKVYPDKENYYWTIFFLLPFTFVYGLLGKLSLYTRINPAFDYHLSFFWAVLVSVFLIISKKRRVAHQFPVIYFIPETVSIILLFNFCSNVENLAFVSKHFNYLFPLVFMKDPSKFFFIYKRFCIAVYTLGVFLILGLYILQLRRIKLLNIKQYQVIALSLLIVLGSLAGSYLGQYRSFISKIQSTNGTRQNDETKKVPYVFLLVLDTFRGDLFSSSRIPQFAKNLKALAEEVVVFENCIASSSWTAASHASIFTGLSPIEHGTHGLLQEKPWFDGFPAIRPINDNFTTLAEIFKNSGYKTAAIVSNFFGLAPNFKFNKGFQTYYCDKNIGDLYVSYPFKPALHFFCSVAYIKIKYSLPYNSAEDMNEITFSLLDFLAPSPFFLFLNYMDAHTPNRPPRPFDTYFLETAFPQLYKIKQMILQFFNRLDSTSRNAFELTQYKGEIAYLDHELGNLFLQLKKRGIYDSSLIVITADHGEAFGEHGYVSHRTPLYEEVIRIPLIIKFPFNKKIGRIKDYIILSDLYPSILSICDLPIPKYISGNAFGSSSPVVSEFRSYDLGENLALYNGKYKLLTFEKQKKIELYDIANDPLEKINLAEKLPAVVDDLKNKLNEWRKKHRPLYKPQDNQGKIDLRNAKEKMKALGYIQ